MTSFVVISTTQALHSLVDGMFLCRPLNPAIDLFFSSGKLLRNEEFLKYESIYEQEISNNSEEVNDLIDLLRNQLSHTRRSANNKGCLRVFLLENPITEEAHADGDWFYDTLCEIREKKYDSQIIITRICFTFDVTHPKNVAKECPATYLRIRRESLQGKGDSMLLLDNQNTSSAALCNTSADYPLMMQRMLTDFMMLLSSNNTAYNMATAVLSLETQSFALGYSECFYYYPDVKRYFELANYRDLIAYQLTTKDIHEDKGELEIEKVPFGLNECIKRLSPIYTFVPFYEKIDAPQYEQSIDKTIDNIVRSFKDLYIAYRDKKIEYARAQDIQDTQAAQEKADQEGLEITVENKRENEKKALQKYIEYCDRSIFYRQSPKDDAYNEEYNHACQNKYDKLLTLLKDADFDAYIEDRYTPKEDEVINNNLPSEKKSGCLGFLFRKREESPVAPLETISEEDKLQDYRSKIDTIIDLQKKREKFYKLERRVKTMQQEVEDKTQEIKHFTLTSHCTSQEHLINLQGLKDYQQQDTAKRNTDIQTAWLNLPAQKQVEAGILIKMNNENTADEVKKYRWVDWEHPFPFIRNLSPNDLTDLVNKLQDASSPLLNYTNTKNTQAENAICLYAYTDNQSYHNPLKNKELDDIKNQTKLRSEVSRHIASKLCVFQILQISNNIWDSAVDATDYTEQEDSEQADD